MRYFRLVNWPTEAESLAGLLNNSSLLKLRLGRVDVRFQKPWSLRAFIEEQQQRRSIADAGSRMRFADNKEHKAILLRAIGYQVLSDINDVSIIMPGALVGTVLLTLRGRVRFASLLFFLCSPVVGSRTERAHPASRLAARRHHRARRASCIVRGRPNW